MIISAVDFILNDDNHPTKAKNVLFFFLKRNLNSYYSNKMQLWLRANNKKTCQLN